MLAIVLSHLVLCRPEKVCAAHLLEKLLAEKEKNKSIETIAGDCATYRVKALANYCKAFDERSSRQKFLRCNTIVAHPLWFLVVKPTSKKTSMAQVWQTDG